MYNDFESRDLWSYNLNLTPEEVDMLVRHLWEVGNSYFDYYFFTQNCASHMLTTLEAAAPRYNLIARVPPYVIPSDAIKAISAEPGLVESIHFRPSLRSVFLYRYKEFNLQQQNIFQKYMKTRSVETLTAAPEAEQVGLLDAALDYIDMAFSENMLDPESASAIQKYKILRTRAQLKTSSPDVFVPLDSWARPDKGHGSARAALGYGSNYNKNPSSTLEMRFALHDLLDSDQGYPEYSQLEFGSFKGTYDHDKSVLRLD